MFPFDDVIMIMYSTAITTSEHAAYLTSHKTSHTPHVRANRMSITVIVEKIDCIITTLDCFSALSVSITGICYLSPEGFSDVDTFLTVIQCHHPPIIRQNQGHTECTVAGIYSCIGLKRYWNVRHMQTIGQHKYIVWYLSKFPSSETDNLYLDVRKIDWLPENCVCELGPH